MLTTPRIYSTAQTLDRGLSLPVSQQCASFRSLTGWQSDFANASQVARMLLSYQAGSVRVGEVVRYTLSYTPAADPIYPPPAGLYVKVKNTSATPLRAAYLHGPYTLYAACYPSTFDPNAKYDQPDAEGFPQFEPYLKAGGSWDAIITIPQRIRQTPTELVSADPESCQSMTWVIEIASQVVFSSTAAVNFEVLVGRDEKSVQLSTGGVSSTRSPLPAQLQDHWSSRTRGEQVLAKAGVYSKAISLQVDDTASLWNSPSFPSFEENQRDEAEPSSQGLHAAANRTGSAGHQTIKPQKSAAKKKKKKVHFVVLTHGLHSNLGADMLYLKESIDVAAKRACERSKQNRQAPGNHPVFDNSSGPARFSHDVPDSNDDGEGEDDDEQVIVRGFFGNAVRTERGIQYLGKRLAKYVLLMTYPDQPYFPLEIPKEKPFPGPLADLKATAEQSANDSSLLDDLEQGPDHKDQAYQITSISFIGHSLGGLVQTYAIAYIQKYSPQFFHAIRPVNFITLATPFLGLSNENPVYVRFALDLGLVGRTGQDLGLSWTAPKVRSGWGAIIGGKGEATKPQGHSDPGSKPLLRVLPCGPAHEVLVKFQHRTIYSNVVNDGIVPLRTSSLFFLDWRGLDRVEKARRENGLVGTMAEWGWAELTGANSKSPRSARTVPSGICEEGSSAANDVALSQQRNAPGDNTGGAHISLEPHQRLGQPYHSESHDIPLSSRHGEDSSQNSFSPLRSLFSFFGPRDSKTATGHKQTKIYTRSQTVRTTGYGVETRSSIRPYRPEMPIHKNPREEERLYTPPKTTFFESASDLLMPPLPPIEFILDPASRARTIFHDRIYHPGDIPPPAPVKRRTLHIGTSQSKNAKAEPEPLAELPYASHHGRDEPESGLRVEEKIARAYHRDLSWRKVLVRLEPDAHNNIIVRRMFTNAFGWPVIKHLVDTHFGCTSAAKSEDVFDKGVERAKSPMTRTTDSGNEVKGQTDPPLAQEAPSDQWQQSLRGINNYDHDGPSQSADPLERANAGRPREHIYPMEGYVDEISNMSTTSGPESVRWSDHAFGGHEDEDEDDDSQPRLDMADGRRFAKQQPREQ